MICDLRCSQIIVNHDPGLATPAPKQHEEVGSGRDVVCFLDVFLLILR